MGNRAMWRAICEAQCGHSSRTNALRAIRRFEEVNGISFNPLDKSHVDRVRDCGRYEAFFRAAKRVLRA